MYRRKLAHIERKILCEIVNSKTGFTSLERLREIVGLTDRTIKHYIEGLRRECNVPILSFRSQGYFIPKNEKERQDGILVYEKQVETELKMISILKTADLSAWEELLEEKGE